MVLGWDQDRDWTRDRDRIRMIQARTRPTPRTMMERRGGKRAGSVHHRCNSARERDSPSHSLLHASISNTRGRGNTVLHDEGLFPRRRPLWANTKARVGAGPGPGPSRRDTTTSLPPLLLSGSSPTSLSERMEKQRRSRKRTTSRRAMGALTLRVRHLQTDDPHTSLPTTI